jgi:hypothetical protein
MGKLRVSIDVNVPKDVLLDAWYKFAYDFFEKFPHYKKWYNFQILGDKIVYEVKAYSTSLKFYSKIEALDDNRSRVTTEAYWSTLKNILTFGLVKSLARFGIDTALLELISFEYGYQYGQKTKK